MGEPPREQPDESPAAALAHVEQQSGDSMLPQSEAAIEELASEESAVLPLSEDVAARASPEPAWTDAERLFSAAQEAETAGASSAAVAWHAAAGAFTLAASRQPDAPFLLERAAECRARAVSLQAASAARRAEEERTAAEARKRDRPSPITALAALGGAAAFIYSGPLLAVAAAGACIAGSYRKDAVGSGLNAVGETAADAMMHARGFNREHGLTVRAKEAARAAAAKVEHAEDQLMTVAPNAAAALGTAVRGVKIVVENSPVAMALEHAIGDSEKPAGVVATQPRSLLERLEGKQV